MSKIEWTEQTYNPIIGCSKISEGCRNCYAEKTAARLGNIPATREDYSHVVLWGTDTAGMYTCIPQWNGKTHLVESALDKPLRRKKPTVYFVCSMGDLFHENNKTEWILRVWSIMAQCPQHIFLVLTKRSHVMYDLMPCIQGNGSCEFDVDGEATPSYQWPQWPLPNVYLGVTVENSDATPRIEDVINTEAAKRFISIEPMLEEIDITPWVENIDQVIVGGESGPNARPMHPDWVRSIRDQCEEAGTPFFLKQWGKWLPLAGADEASQYPDAILHEWPDGNRSVQAGKKKAGRKLDGRTHDKLIWK